MDRDRLQQLRAEYNAAYIEHLSHASANNGAVQAIDRILAEMDAPKPESANPTAQERVDAAK